MARKIKHEVRSAELLPDMVAIAMQENRQDIPMSSGDTIPGESAMNPDVAMLDATGNDHNLYPAASTLSVRSISSTGTVTPTSGEGLQMLGRGVKELVLAVQNLRNLGVEKLVLPLPKIVVVGDQSTGKSSLIEGISEIKLPRSAGTCTRCPLEINLTETNDLDTEWSCTVSLVQKFVYDGSLGKKAVLGKAASRAEGATFQRPLGPWNPTDYPEDLPFAFITSKAEVIDALERAQLAILNPSSSYEKYRPGNPVARTTQVKFSPNIIRLDISGPGLPNLSFYDLPGVINVSEVPEEAYLVDLVRNLVKEYIQAEDCINLLALTMTDDPANSSAFSLVKKVKAEGRTVGCLTKPDRIQNGESLDQWIQVLSGERFHLGFGYHVIKNNPDARVDHATARKEEAAFFDENEPWTTTLNAHSRRFGTLLLQTALSQRLTAQIRTSLPRIIDQVQQKADYIDARLRELPEPLDGNLPAVIMGELLKFEREVEKHIEGAAQENTFQKEWNKRAMEFRKVLADSRPVLVFPNPPMPSQSRGTPVNERTVTPSPSARKTITIFEIDSHTDNKPSPAQTGRKRPHGSTQSTPSKISRVVPRSAGYGVFSRRFSLEEVRSIIQDAYVGLYGQIDPKATERMIKLSMEHWSEPVNHFLVLTRKLCENLVFQQIQKVFGHRQQTAYYDTVLEICHMFFEKVCLEQQGIAEQILRWEQLRPGTLDDDAMKIAYEKAQALLHARDHEVRARIYIEDQETRSGKFTTGQARIEKVSKVTDTQLPPTVHSLEMTTMSTVKGYYEYAFSRFVDTLCASIQCELFFKCRTGIVHSLKTKFAVTEPGADERCARLLAADPEQEEQRVQFKKEKDTIEKAQEQLRGLSHDDLYKYGQLRRTSG